MKRWGAVILAAGSSTRFGSDKLELQVNGRPLWQASLQPFLNHPLVSEVVLVTRADRVLERAGRNYVCTEGGANRQESAFNGLCMLSAEVEFVLIHDGARPFVDADLIDRVMQATEQNDAAVPCLPLVDTVKRVQDGLLSHLDRDSLRSVQTPQAGRKEDFLRAHQAAGDALYSDDIALLELIGVHASPVEGNRDNIKVTSPEDGERIQMMKGFPEYRTGLGYDIHAFSQDPTRALWLGGVQFENSRGLEGHSDADVLLHAITDAVLGGAGLGDIGQHFPNTDPEWKNKSSLHFLQHAVQLAKNQGWEVTHIDASLVGEEPKVMPRAQDIRSVIARAIGREPDQISLKATTNEKLGAIGRSEGIAAFAVATLRRDP